MGGPKRTWYMRSCQNEKCPRPNREFAAFRSTAKFCTDTCRIAAYRRSQRAAKREKMLAQFGHACAVCKTTGVKGRLFVRKVDGNMTDLCGEHNSVLSRTMFYKRVPNPGRGYAWRKFWERLIAEDAESAA